jgi:hypothetical protein
MKHNTVISSINNSTRAGKSMTSLKSTRKQRGFSLIELGIVILVLVIALGSLGALGVFMQGWWSGNGEGQRMTSTLNCVRIKQTQPLFTGVTLAATVNQGCFGEDNVTGKGTATATARNNEGQNYVVNVVNLKGTAGDGLELVSPGISESACNSAVKALVQIASRIVVTPTVAAATPVTVKAVGQPLSNALLTTACSNGDVSVAGATTKSGT